MGGRPGEFYHPRRQEKKEQQNMDVDQDENQVDEMDGPMASAPASVLVARGRPCTGRKPTAFDMDAYSYLLYEEGKGGEKKEVPPMQQEQQAKQQRHHQHHRQQGGASASSPTNFGGLRIAFRVHPAYPLALGSFKRAGGECTIRDREPTAFDPQTPHSTEPYQSSVKKHCRTALVAFTNKYSARMTRRCAQMLKALGFPAYPDDFGAVKGYDDAKFNGAATPHEASGRGNPGFSGFCPFGL